MHTREYLLFIAHLPPTFRGAPQPTLWQWPDLGDLSDLTDAPRWPEGSRDGSLTESSESYMGFRGVLW